MVSLAAVRTQGFPVSLLVSQMRLGVTPGRGRLMVMADEGHRHPATSSGRLSPRSQALHRENHVVTEAWFADQFVAVSHTMWAIAVSITGNRTLAEDVVQESAAIALTKLREFERGTNFSAWLGKIVRYVALNHARRVQRSGTAATDPVVLDRVPAGGRAEAAARTIISGRGELGIDEGCFDDRLTHALHSLDETARSCLLLRTLLDLPYREIAAALDIPEGTAMSHVHRARQAMRSMLTEETPTTEAEDNA